MIGIGFFCKEKGYLILLINNNIKLLHTTLWIFAIMIKVFFSKKIFSYECKLPFSKPFPDPQLELNRVCHSIISKDLCQNVIHNMHLKLI